MNKTIFIGVGGIIVVGLFILAYQLTSPVVPAPSAMSTSTAPSAVVPASPVGQNTIGTPDQGTTAGGISTGVTQVIDFMKDPATVKDSSNTGYYYLGYHTSQGVDDTTATDNPPYLITYISATKYFNITILQEPIGPVREEAQQYLLAHLGIGEQQMCQLNYMVSVPDRVNSQFSGIHLGFSFCPGATLLPK